MFTGTLYGTFTLSLSCAQETSRSSAQASSSDVSNTAESSSEEGSNENNTPEESSKEEYKDPEYTLGEIVDSGTGDMYEYDYGENRILSI